jgi:hypothetical protein
LYSILEKDRGAAALLTVFDLGDLTGDLDFDAEAVGGLLGPDTILADLRDRGAAVFAVRGGDAVSVLSDEPFPFGRRRDGDDALAAWNAAIRGKGHLYCREHLSTRAKIRLWLDGRPDEGAWVAEETGAELALRELQRRRTTPARYFAARNGRLVVAGQGDPPRGATSATAAEVLALFDELVRCRAKGGTEVHLFGAWAES